MSCHITFLTLPAAGHVLPTLPLVEELVRRGHRVSYSGGGDLAEAVTAAGATPISLNRERLRMQAPTPDADVAEILIGGLHQVRAVLPVLAEKLTADGPDLLCYDALTPYGPLLARKLGLRAVMTVPIFAGNEHVDVQSLLVPPTFGPDHPRMAEYLAERDKVATDFGVPAGDYPAELNLVFIPREFQLRGETFDDRYRFIGPSLGRRADADDWRPPAGADRVLFISLGTVANDRPDFFARCVTAFGGSDWHVVMAVGGQVDPATLGEIPANFQIAPHFPQPTVLKHATAFLTHTGMNSVMEALIRQVPIVAFPQTPEQTANAERARELGLGTITDLDRLRETVDDVAHDRSIRDNLAAMARHIDAAGGPKTGADAIDELTGSV